eukprot:7383519-Prymnesium_polylepis.3
MQLANRDFAEELTNALLLARLLVIHQQRVVGDGRVDNARCPFRFCTCDQLTPSSRSVSFLRFAAAAVRSRFAVAKLNPSSPLSARARASRLGAGTPRGDCFCGDELTATQTASANERRSSLARPFGLPVSAARCSIRCIC